MKRKTKQMLAILLAMVMVMAMGVSVFASSTDGDGGSGDSNPSGETTTTEQTTTTATTHTVSVKAGTDTSHEYQIYQIFTGEYSSTSNQLTNLKYGQNAKIGVNVGDAISQADAATLKSFETKTYENDQARIDDLVQFVNLSSSPVATLSTKTGGTTSAALEEGYYIIKDTDNSLTGTETYTLYLFKLLNADIEITPKSGKPESEKHVNDQNDSDSTDHYELKDSADYDIGDSVPYTLTFKLPSDYANYESYKVVFSDDMCAGLTYNNDAKIYYGTGSTTGTTISFSADSAEPSAYTNGTVYKATINDLKTTAPTLAAGDVIRIEYTATLNSSAAIGSAGNKNTYSVEFSNSPNAGASGTTGKTPDDTNIVFTYKAVFNKVDPDGKPLTGADFILYKFVESSAGTETYEGKSGIWTDVTTLHTETGAVNPSKLKTTSTGTEEDLTNGTKFTFEGLDAGVYKLSETTTPTGYNSIADKIFTITAEHDLVSADPTLTSLSASGTDITLTAEKFTGTTNPTGSLSADIENKSGSTLPETGGIGTTILYVGCAVLLVLAAVLIIVRKRLSASE